MMFNKWNKYMHIRKLILFTAFVAGTHCVASDYYVSPNGSDANPGSQAKPLATLEGARDVVRRQIAGGKKEDLSVHIGGGNYFVDSPISFDERDCHDG